MTENRRTSSRHAVSLAGQLQLNEQPRPITVLNLSLGGALVAAGTRISMGEHVQISFVVPTIDEPIEIGATVRWSDDATTGLQFDGLRARDVWALNKFFEQLPASP